MRAINSKEHSYGIHVIARHYRFMFEGILRTHLNDDVVASS